MNALPLQWSVGPFVVRLDNGFMRLEAPDAEDEAMTYEGARLLAKCLLAAADDVLEQNGGAA